MSSNIDFYKIPILLTFTSIKHEKMIAFLLIGPLCTAIVGYYTYQRSSRIGNIGTLATSVCSSIFIFNRLYNAALTSHTKIIVHHIIGLHFFKIEFASHGCGIVFCGLLAILHPIAILYAIGYFSQIEIKNKASFFFYFNIAITCGLGIGISWNLFTAFLFYELITISTYPLICANRTNESIQSARHYIVILLSTSTLLLLPGIAFIYYSFGNITFSTNPIINPIYKINPTSINIAMMMILFGIAKTAILPLHTWLTRAMTAPIPVSALLHAVIVVKSGIFLLIMATYYIFDLKTLRDNLWQIHGYNWIFWIGVVTILYAGAKAIYSKDIKQRLAFSTIGQLSYIIMIISLIYKDAIVISMMQLVSHAIAKITLFFGAGVIYILTKETKIYKMGGMIDQTKLTVIMMLLASMSLLGMPLTAGFQGKYNIIYGAFLASNNILWYVIAIATTLSTSYLVPMIYRLMEHKQNEHKAGIKLVPIEITISMTICSALIVILFFTIGYIKTIM